MVWNRELQANRWESAFVMVTKPARLTHAITVMHCVVKVMDLGIWQTQGGCKRQGGVLPDSRRKLHIKDFFVWFVCLVFFYGWDGEHSVFVVEVRVLCSGLLLFVVHISHGNAALSQM